MVFMTFHYAESATNLLTIDAVDPIAKIPEYKVCAVQIEKLGIRNYELGIGRDTPPSASLVSNS